MIGPAASPMFQVFYNLMQLYSADDSPRAARIRWTPTSQFNTRLPMGFLLFG